MTRTTPRYASWRMATRSSAGYVLGLALAALSGALVVALLCAASYLVL